jgi:putative ABC transport system permease protein
VLKERGSTFGNSQDLRVMIPIQVARSLFSAPNINYSLSTMIEKSELFDDAVDNALNTMRKVRKLNPVEENNFAISRSDDLINRIASITDVLSISAWVMGIITILGSSIALMNIMVVSVTERTREIGVRKALGATPLLIRIQFLTEAVAICILGGSLGIILGIAAGNAVSVFIGNGSFIIPWLWIGVGLTLCVSVGIFSGLYPAIKASRLDPVEALRFE